MARKSRRKKIEEVVSQAAVVSEIIREEPKMETAAYARLSVDKGFDEKIETQVEMLHQYIEGRSDLVLADTYVDNGYSGTNFDRPEFNRLMEDVSLQIKSQEENGNFSNKFYAGEIGMTNRLP